LSKNKKWEKYPEMSMNGILNFKNSREWRRWLQINHALMKEAWLNIYKKSGDKAGIGYQEAVEEALCFGWIDGKMQSIDKHMFALRFSPRKARSVWSKVNKEKALQLIASGKMTEAGLSGIEAARENGSWDNAYTNLEKDSMPPDLETALAGNKDARANFSKFANSYRNMYIGWITGAKTEATRRKRIAEVIRRSALNLKPGM
jgi:uncharacterized protein YdeI (YjbR/CyaY-like superfamily)